MQTKHLLSLIILLHLNSAEAEQFSISKSCLAPVSSIIQENPLIVNRTDKNIAQILDINQVSSVADEYLSFLERTLKNKKDRTLSVRLYFHNDADGVASAKIIETFFKAYLLNSDFSLLFEATPREPRNKVISREGCDIIFVADLFWSQMVTGVDMAIDHHYLKKDEQINSFNNNKLINLSQLGYKGNIRNESKLIPASVLSAIFLDYTLKKGGVTKGLLAAETVVFLNALLDCGIAGDSSEPTAENPDKGFKVLNRKHANALKYISEIGEQGIEIILNKPLDEIINYYSLLKPQTEAKVSEYMEEFSKIDSSDLAAMFIDSSETTDKETAIEIDIFNDILTKCCNYEKKSRSADKRRIILLAKINKRQSLLQLSLRFDGLQDILSLDHLHSRLKKPSNNDQWDAGFFMEGGGHAIAKSIRIPLQNIKGDPQLFFNDNIIPAIRSALKKIKNDRQKPFQMPGQINLSS